MKPKDYGEPWETRDMVALRTYARIYRKDDPGIDCICTMRTSNCPGWREDRDRIIACVNACKGLNPEGVSELLEAAGDIVGGIYKWDDFEAITLDRLRDALKKVKGE